MFMTDLADVADQCAARAAEMRTLARGVFGTEERASLMEFIADYAAGASNERQGYPRPHARPELR
jgi:hypothetical protein